LLLLYLFQSSGGKSNRSTRRSTKHKRDSSNALPDTSPNQLNCWNCGKTSPSTRPLPTMQKTQDETNRRIRTPIGTYTSHTELLPTYQHALLSVLVLLHCKAQSTTALEQVVNLCWQSDLRGFILKYQGIHKEACALKMMSLAVICCCCACFMLATCNFENTHSF
jgi:hypothetical protein